MNIVLLEPEIPFNTGAIGRTCVATGTALHLIRPYGFILSDRKLRRAGLDYWSKLDLTEYKSYGDFIDKHADVSCKEKPDAPRLWFATTKAEQTYADVSYGGDDYIMFGKETAGIPEEILAGNKDSCIRIPMYGGERSLNLSNSAAIILYEALRQNGFDGLEKTGSLHHLEWRDDSPTKRIYEAVKKVPSGKVATYGQIAELAGDKKMARAVGNALHKNNDPERVPCYRIVNSKGELAGEFAFGGAGAQARLLEADGIEVTDGRVDLSVYGIDVRDYLL